MTRSIATCTHIQPTGRRCGSPALRGEQFCFYHHPTRRPPARTPTRTPFDVPAITDPETLQMTLSEVIRRLADNTLDTRRAGLLLITLQMAKANLPQLLPYLYRESIPGESPSSPAPGSPDLPDLSTLLSELGLQRNHFASKT